MEFFTEALSYIVVGDIFEVASRSWGLEIMCLCLIPAFFSALLLFVATFRALQATLTDETRKGNKGTWRLLTIAVGVLALLQLVRWGEQLGVVQGAAISFPLPTVLLGIEAAGFLLVLLLLFMLSVYLPPRMKVYLTLALLYGGVAFFALWNISNTENTLQIVSLAAESLLFVGFGYIVGFIHRLSVDVFAHKL